MNKHGSMGLGNVIYADSLNPSNCTCQKEENYLRIIPGRPSMTLMEVLIEKYPAKTLGEGAGVYKPVHSLQALRDFTYWTLENQTRWWAAIYSYPVTVSWLFFDCKLLDTGGEFISISKIRKQHLPTDADMLQDVDLLWSVSLCSPEPSENT